MNCLKGQWDLVRQREQEDWDLYNWLGHYFSAGMLNLMSNQNKYYLGYIEMHLDQYNMRYHKLEQHCTLHIPLIDLRYTHFHKRGIEKQQRGRAKSCNDFI